MLNVIIAILVSALILGIVWNQLITSISFKIVDDTTDIKKPPARISNRTKHENAMKGKPF